MTRAEAKANIIKNLYDGNVVYYDGIDLNNSIQDAYDDIAIIARNIKKKSTGLAWVGQLSYYDFTSLGVADYLGCIAIFNNVSNVYLTDDLTLKDFDRIRVDWEAALGTPEWWTPVNFKYIAVFKKYAGAAGTFDLHYWATAPTLTSDSDVFLIATDMAKLIEYYCTADLFEQAQEFSKAAPFWKLYYPLLQKYKTRCHGLAKSDLLYGV